MPSYADVNTKLDIRRLDARPGAGKGPSGFIVGEHDANAGRPCGRRVGEFTEFE